MSAEYLSHEFMSAHWAPAFHADVAAAMAEAKLDWVASANPLENFNELMLTEEQRALLDRHPEALIKQLARPPPPSERLDHHQSSVTVHQTGADRYGHRPNGKSRGKAAGKGRMPGHTGD